MWYFGYLRAIRVHEAESVAKQWCTHQYHGFHGCTNYGWNWSLLIILPYRVSCDIRRATKEEPFTNLCPIEVVFR
jgi:hypothetical protein